MPSRGITKPPMVMIGSGREGLECMLDLGLEVAFAW
jgi:hypothetical protein